MRRQQPRSISGAIGVLAAMVVLSGLTALLTVVYRDRLVRSWETGHPDVGGALQPPAFVPVAIVLFCVFALLAGVLVSFLRGGHPWARLALSGLSIFMAVVSLAGLRSDPPTLFLVLPVVWVALDLALLVCLWLPATSAYVNGSWESDPAPTRPSA
ncbi:hypothetical protein [Nocardioides panaciterrulae]|uniref:Integral membrane protein n=1 Tax=Nocardioides panaciterrulae TaxID=661492 RepID=A0A7Y9E563_9ACTN|nr:hypothetical protein [Nocardioides panaciterrulae]NYD41456.1 hypothetical protein [Nocardioides panaciterrulae]